MNELCPGRDLNPHEPEVQGILSPLCLPIPPPGRDMRRRPDSNRCIKVLQTSPLPLGYGAVSIVSQSFDGSLDCQPKLFIPCRSNGRSMMLLAIIPADSSMFHETYPQKLGLPITKFRSRSHATDIRRIIFYILKIVHAMTLSLKQ